MGSWISSTLKRSRNHFSMRCFMFDRSRFNKNFSIHDAHQVRNEGSGGRTGNNTSIQIKESGVARTNNELLVTVPIHDASQMSTNSRKRLVLRRRSHHEESASAENHLFRTPHLNLIFSSDFHHIVNGTPACHGPKISQRRKQHSGKSGQQTAFDDPVYKIAARRRTRFRG